jgi:hypothetical protein
MSLLGKIFVIYLGIKCNFCLVQVQQVEGILREKLYDLESGQKVSRISRLLKENGSALECYNKVRQHFC